MKDYSPIYQRFFFVIFWVAMCFGFVSQEVIPPLTSWHSGVFLMVDIMWVMLAALTVRRVLDVVLIVSFVMISYISTCTLNDLSLVFWINGLRDFLGLLLAYPVMCYFMCDPTRRERFESSLDRQLIIFLVIQAICVTYQFLKYGAGDHGGGSLGNNGSGNISMIIYLVSYYLLHKRLDTDNFFVSLNENKLLIILLFPTFLNETKISFILIVIYFALLLPFDRRYILRAMWAVPIVMCAIWVGSSVYGSVVKSTDEDFISMEFLSHYLSLEDVSTAEQGALWDIDQGRQADVPRIAKLMYLPILHTQEPGHEAMGFGLGQFKGGTTLELSDFAYKYDWLLMGSIPYLFHVYIQLGMVGIVFLFGCLMYIFLIKPSWSVGRDYNMQLFVAIVLMLIMFYNDSLRVISFTMILFFFFAASWTVQNDIEEAEEETECENN